MERHKYEIIGIILINSRIFLGSDCMTNEWDSIEEVHAHAKKAVNKKVKEIVNQETVLNYNPKNKGWVGNSIESDWFGLPNNSRQEADFQNLNLELKVTPIRETKKGWSAKERLVLNIFDFHDEYKRQFKNASFLEKSNLMELIYYEFIKETPAPEFYIKAATLFNLDDIPEEDKLIIRQDWELIVNKIKEGKAEELSDSLTKYLGATTKGAKTEKNMTTQPFSDVKAHRRSFTLKGSYMTELARKIMSGKYKDPYDHLSQEDSYVAESSVAYYTPEPIIKDIEQLKVKTFEEIIIELFDPFINLTKTKLGNIFNIDIPKINDKASSPILARKMLNLQTNIEDTEEFRKAGISTKVVTVHSNQMNNPYHKRKTTEPFKLQNFFDFQEIVEESWEESDLYEYLSSARFLLVIFEKTPTEEVFKGVKFWSMPNEDLNGLVYETWRKTVDIFKDGVTLKYVPQNTKKGYKVGNNLPAIKDKTILHIRPDAPYSSYKNNRYALRLPAATNWINRPASMNDELTDYYMTKQAFWLNSSYMYQQIKVFFE